MLRKVEKGVAKTRETNTEERERKIRENKYRQVQRKEKQRNYILEKTTQTRAATRRRRKGEKGTRKALDESHPSARGIQGDTVTASGAYPCKHCHAEYSGTFLSVR